MKDNHCIWFNQCIGQSNLIYYIIYKNFGKLFTDFSFNKNTALITCIILDLIYIIFSFKLLYDQYTNLSYYNLMYNRKRKKYIEIRTKNEMLCEDFGDEFGINCFIPIKTGGFYGLIKNKNVFKTGS